MDARLADADGGGEVGIAEAGIAASTHQDLGLVQEFRTRVAHRHDPLSTTASTLACLDVTKVHQSFDRDMAPCSAPVYLLDGKESRASGFGRFDGRARSRSEV